MSSIKDRLAAANAPAWMPTTKGDLLCGRVVNRSTRTTDFGEYEIVTIDPAQGGEVSVGGSATFTVKTADGDAPYAGGPLAWHAMGGVATNEVERSDPRIGDDAGVLFDGTGIAQSGLGKGKSYRIFRVVVDKAPQNVGVPAQALVAEVDVPAEQYDDGDEPF